MVSRARALITLLAVGLALAVQLAAPPAASAEPPAPICSLSARVGPSSGGTEVTLASGGLFAVTSVKFGGVEAAGFSVARDDLLVAVTPPHPEGTVDVTVTTPEGTSPPCEEPGDDDFRFVEPFGGTWSLGSRMAFARGDHTATPLRDGRVLMLGGNRDEEGNTPPTEIYDPATRNWRVRAEMNTPRGGATATVLTDGRVLVAGGSGLISVDPDTGERTFGDLASAELYDPVTNAWTVTANNLRIARGQHTATRLADGRVLVVGGTGLGSGQGCVNADGSPRTCLLSTVELYDPATNRWSSCPPPATPSAACPGPLNDARRSHSATALSNGKVLVAQGKGNNPSGSPVQISLASTELYDPLTGTWSRCSEATASAACPGPLAIPRFGATSVTLTDGKALVVGGQPFNGSRTGSVEEYDPATGRWGPTGFLGAPRTGNQTTLLANGTVLVTGGLGRSTLEATTELYDPVARRWRFTDFQIIRRSNHTATLLPSGRVLVAGGQDSAGALIGQSELFTPAPAVLPPVVVPPVTGPAVQPSAPPRPSDTARPLLTALSLSPAAFGAADKGATIAAQVGSKVSYRLSERAAVRFRVERAVVGRRAGGQCVKSTPSNRRKKRCTRYVALRGGFTHGGTAGQNRFTFSGRLLSRKLAPGRYRLRAVATDAAGNASRPALAGFRIVGD